MEAHPGPKVVYHPRNASITPIPDYQSAEWLEYSSPEQHCTMEYNPLTSETRSPAEPTEQDQVGTVSFFPGEESSSSLERARQTMEEQLTSEYS